MSEATLATLLLAARRTGTKIGALAPAREPSSETEAYAAQEEVLQHLGAQVAGWKVGATSPTEPPSGAPLFAELVAPSPARAAAPAQSFRGVEAEIAMRLARDLPARAASWSEAEAWAAVGSLHVGLELLDSRFADRKAHGRLALLADNFSNAFYCYGAAIAGWETLDLLTLEARLLIDGKEAAKAVGGNPSGHPRRLLAWLANHAAARGRPLKAGQIVTTGSHTGVVIAPPGATVAAEFPGLGRAVLTLA